MAQVHKPIDPSLPTEVKMTRFLPLALLLLVAPAWSAAALDLTPAQTEGPYYPRRKPADTDWDLTRVGNGPRAKGEALALVARVVDPQGKPIAGARVEIWQTDAAGIYMHPDDPRTAKRDQTFQFYGEARSDADGNVRFLTIRPVPYEGRPSHIHAKITPPRGATLTTQFYFADDPQLARDGIVRRLGKVLELVTLRPQRKTGADGASLQEAAITIVVKAGRPAGR